MLFPIYVSNAFFIQPVAWTLWQHLFYQIHLYVHDLYQKFHSTLKYSKLIEHVCVDNVEVLLLAYFAVMYININ